MTDTFDDKRLERVLGRGDGVVRCLRFAALTVGLVLAGCAARPGPEVLNPVPTALPGAKMVTVYVATTAEREIPDSNIFANGRARSLNYAEFKISIPPRHQPGNIEWPIGNPDPAISFATVQQSILDKQTFERRVTSGASSSSRAKVGVFVHGFNTNFQEAVYRKRRFDAVQSAGLKFQGMSASISLLGHRLAILSRVCFAQAYGSTPFILHV